LNTPLVDKLIYKGKKEKKRKGEKREEKKLSALFFFEC
jgi:hypothetical protein